MASLTAQRHDEWFDHVMRPRRLGADSDATPLLLGATILGATLLFWLVHQALIDDAYITLTYARTLAEHGQWGMLPGHEANSATSPLNVLLLGGLNAILGDPVVAAGVLYVATCVALVLGLRGLGRATGLGDRVALLGAPLLIASPLLASTIGMETMLVVTAMVYLAWACVRQHPVLAGLTTGVLLWLRLDVVVIAAVLLLATPALWRRWRVVAGCAAAVVTPWLVFSWFVLGSAIPDTLVIKSGKGWGHFLAALSKHYGLPFTWAVGGVVVIGGVGLLSAATWVWWRRYAGSGTSIVLALVLAGAAYFAVIWSLGVPPFFWYYAPTFAALALAATLGLAAVGTQLAVPSARTAAIAIGAGLLTITAVPWSQAATAHTPLRAMPVRANWALPSQYEQIGRQVGATVGDTPVRTAGEVGTIAYFCYCTIADRFSDRARLVESINEARRESWLLRLNYLMLDTDELRPIEAGYRLDWRSGPGAGVRGWTTTGIADTERRQGHYTLLAHRPHKQGNDGHHAPDRMNPVEVSAQR